MVLIIIRLNKGNWNKYRIRDFHYKNLYLVSQMILRIQSCFENIEYFFVDFNGRFSRIVLRCFMKHQREECYRQLTRFNNPYGYSMIIGYPEALSTGDLSFLVIIVWCYFSSTPSLHSPLFHDNEKYYFTSQTSLDYR